MQWRVGAEFHQRTHGDLGKGRAAAPGIGFGDTRQMLRSIAHAPGGAVDAQQSQHTEEAAWMLRHLSQGAQSLLQDESENI